MGEFRRASCLAAALNMVSRCIPEPMGIWANISLDEGRPYIGMECWYPGEKARLGRLQEDEWLRSVPGRRVVDDSYSTKVTGYGGDKGPSDRAKENNIRVPEQGWVDVICAALSSDVEDMFCSSHFLEETLVSSVRGENLTITVSQEITQGARHEERRAFREVMVRGIVLGELLHSMKRIHDGAVVEFEADLSVTHLNTISFQHSFTAEVGEPARFIVPSDVRLAIEDAVLSIDATVRAWLPLYASFGGSVIVDSTARDLPERMRVYDPNGLALTPPFLSTDP